MYVVAAVAAAALAVLSVSVVWTLNLMLGGHLFHPSIDWFQVRFPTMWQRWLVLAIPFATVNIAIMGSVEINPAWGGAGMIVAGIMMPAAISLVVGGGKPTPEIIGILIGIIVLTFWLGRAMQRTM